MIGPSRKPRLRDPQAGVSFRPSMLVHAGSLSALGAHRIDRMVNADTPGRGRLLPWTVVIAGLMAAFFLGTSWSASPRGLTNSACLAGASPPTSGVSGCPVWNGAARPAR